MRCRTWHRVLLHQQLTIFQGAYPPRDDRIAEIFQTIQDNIGHELGDLALPEHNHHPGRLAAVYSFFGILFRVVREAIELMEPSSPTSAATFPSSWNAHLETNSNRSTMYDKVHSNWFDWKKEKKLDHTYNERPDWETANSSFKQLLALLHPALQNPVYAAQRCSRSDPIKLLLYFDEAQSLVSQKSNFPRKRFGKTIQTCRFCPCLSGQSQLAPPAYSHAFRLP